MGASDRHLDRGGFKARESSSTTACRGPEILLGGLLARPLEAQESESAAATTAQAIALARAPVSPLPMVQIYQVQLGQCQARRRRGGYKDAERTLVMGGIAVSGTAEMIVSLLCEPGEIELAKWGLADGLIVICRNQTCGRSGIEASLRAGVR